MADINTALKKFNANGGTIYFGTAAAGDKINNIVPGSLKVTPGGRSNIFYKDGGVVKAPLVGDEEYTMISFRVRLADYTGSTGPWEKTQTAHTTGTPFSTTLTIRVPDYPGASTGVEWAILTCYMDKQPTAEMGGEGDAMDEVQLDFRSTQTTVLGTTY